MRLIWAILFLSLYMPGARANEQPITAEPLPNVQLQWIDSSGNQVILDWNTTRSWKWQRFSDATLFEKPALEVGVEVPADFEMNGIEEPLRASPSKKELFTEMRSSISMSRFKEKNAGLLLRIDSERPAILNQESCVRQGIRLREAKILPGVSSPRAAPQRDQAFLFIATSCVRDPQKGTLKVRLIRSDDAEWNPQHFALPKTTLEGNSWIEFPVTENRAPESEANMIGTFELKEAAGNHSVSYELIHSAPEPVLHAQADPASSQSSRSLDRMSSSKGVMSKSFSLTLGLGLTYLASSPGDSASMEARIRLKKRILAQTIQTETDLEAGIQAAFAPISQNGSGDLSSPRTFFADAGVQFHLFAPSRTHASFQPRIGAGWALAGNSLSTVRLSPYLTHLYTGPQLYLSSLFQPLGMPEFEMSVSFLPWAESVGSPSSRLSRWSVGGRIPLQKRAGISPWSLGVEYFGSQAAGGPADENYQLTGISTELRFSL